MNGEKYELTSDERKKAEAFIDDWEYHAQEVNFEKLLATAVEACLDKPLPDLERVILTPEQRVVRTNGILGLRTAIEIQMGIEQWPKYEYRKDEESEVGSFYVELDSPMRSKELEFDPSKHHIVRRAEQFGKAIVDESFRVLGQDAYAHIEDMKSGDTKRQQKAINWLYDRIGKLNPREEAEEPENEDDGYLYHPLRLSPKVLGVYPNHSLSPTCLGASIIASSFFEKAGVPYMHAGMAMSAYESRLDDTIGALELVKDRANVESLNSPLVAENMQQKAETARERLNKDRGYHAAVYVKRADDRWILVDPYFNVLSKVYNELNEGVNNIYDTLNEFSELTPSLELSYQFPLLNIERGMRDALHKNVIDKLDDEELHLATKLLLNLDESVPEEIYKQVILPFFENAKEHEGAPNATSILKVLLDTSEGDDFVRDAFYNVFEKYVLWGQPLEEVQAKSRIDKGYLRERMVDLKHIAEIMCAAIAIANVEDVNFASSHHDKVEFGLPHARIGFSVLNDFANYYDDSLPPTFWLTHWSSLIPITETMAREANTTRQRRSLTVAALWSEHKFLTYTKSHRIIDKFLSAQESKEAIANGEANQTGETGSSTA